MKKSHSNIQTLYYEKRRVSIKSIALGGVIMMSFLQQLFLNSISTFAYMALLALLTLVFVTSRIPMKLYVAEKTVLLWLVSILIIWINFLLAGFSYGSLLDVVTLSCGILIALFFSRNVSDYIHCIKILKVGATVFAIGVLLQGYIPSLYKICLNLLPSSFRAAIVVGSVDRTGRHMLNGFATNVGFSAGYICIGIIAIISTMINKKVNKSKIISAIILSLALLLTAKRGPLLFLVLAVILCNFIPVRGNEKLKRYWYMFLVSLFVILGYYVFRDILINIPMFQAIVETIEGIQAGEDVTSLRTALWAWAFNLFLEKPVFGIGWGTFRTTVVGNVSYFTVLDAHNIYLQLLCEMGIVGFLCVVGALVTMWNMTKKAYCMLLTISDSQHDLWKQPLFFSFCFQTFFLLYGFTGNVLYDQYMQIIYMFSCAISLSYRCNEEYQRMLR